ncbi:MAG: putative bifunctional diguanylate cyclase/phosphodiesterase [Alphaproteobacteria bacterium]
MASAPVAQADASTIDFGAPDAVLNLRPALIPENVGGPADPGEVWYTIQVRNEKQQPAARVLAAGDSPSSGLAVWPLRMRPALRAAAASDASVVVERANAFGRHAYRVILPASHAATLALHFTGTQQRPSLIAWTEPALIAHNRRASVLSGVVAGLMTAAAAFAIGVAAITARRFAILTASFLAAVLFANLTATGLFDGGWLTYPGGPYGLFALSLSLAIAVAIRLIDFVAPFEAAQPGSGVWRDRAVVAILLLGVAALVGVPATGLSLRGLAVMGAALAAGYLAHCGRLGVASARKLAPIATIFALVTAAGAFEALGLFEGNLIAPAAIGGFSAAGALLLALACAAGALEPHGASPRATAQALSSIAGPRQGPVHARAMEQSAVAASRQGVFDLNLNTGMVSLGPETAAILGLRSDAREIGRDAWLQRIHSDDRDVYQQAIEAYRLDPGIAFRLEFRARGEGNKTHWFELRATMMGGGGKAERCFGLIADVSARKASEAELALAALSDPLTGLGNRVALLGRLDELDGALGQTSLAVFDIDRFKAVNASVGPEGADTLLRAVAERLNQRFAGNAGLFRVGGDMFALIAENPVTKPQALGEEIIDVMKAPFTLGGRDIFLPASVGVAAGAEAGDPMDLLGQAELAMIQAKRDGGGRVCIYSRALSDTAPKSVITGDPVALETALRNAIKAGQIEVHYQPIMRMRSTGVAGFEALLRWRDPEHGLVAPEEFVAHSEETGLIVPLGRLVLKRAAKDVTRWQQFFPLKPSLFVNINVSFRQICDESFLKDLETVLSREELPKRSLRLELTESAVMADADAAEVILKRLRRLGAGLAMDDFGTGHSSLSQLKRFPFDIIKIDRGFLVETRKSGSDTILASVIALAHELGMQVIAEGVESEDDAERLRSLGCEYAQGFLYGAPIPASDVNSFVAMNYKK